MVLKKWAAGWELPTDHFDPGAATARAMRSKRRPVQALLTEHSTVDRTALDLKIGTRVCCYKHVDTRRSLHVDEDLNAFVYCFDERRPGPGHYARVSLDEAFALALLHPAFEDGWIEHRRFDRPWRVDEEGNDIEPEDDHIDAQVGFVTYWEERKAFEAWKRLNQGFASEASR